MQTERLTLRTFTQKDIEFLYVLNNDPQVNRYRSRATVSMAYCEDSIRDWNTKYGEGLLNVYLVALSETATPIGLMAIFKGEADERAELGYRFLPEYWQKGYCKEAATHLIVEYFTASQEEFIIAETHPENTNSIRFLEKNHFEEQPRLKDRGSIFQTRKVDWFE